MQLRVKNSNTQVRRKWTYMVYNLDSSIDVSQIIRIKFFHLATSKVAKSDR